jgi:peptide/nickel transport system substrate-binding protein
MLLDQLPICRAGAERTSQSGLASFVVAGYKSGQYVQLRRNPYYWKTENGRRLPRVDAIRLDIQTNRDTELLRFRRGEIHFVDKLEPEAFERLRQAPNAGAINAGPSLDAEFFWFNQKPGAPIAPYKLRWFQSTRFRRAISAAVNRDDIVRVVYRGFAKPASGPISPTNRTWYNPRVSVPKYDPAVVLKLLSEDGFRLNGGILRDHDNRTVEFSLLTNAGSRVRSQIGAMIQQDLKKIGIQVNFAPVEFQSLVERISTTQDYEACLLGLTNVELDPNSQANVWLSSGTHHAWNAEQLKPATPWEAEIDQLMRVQATAGSEGVRKKAFDRVQEIIMEQAPMIYLAYPDVLLAISPLVRGAAPSALPPHIIWNVEQLYLAPRTAAAK